MGTRPVAMRSAVVLPQPDSSISATISPSLTLMPHSYARKGCVTSHWAVRISEAY